MSCIGKNMHKKYIPKNIKNGYQWVAKLWIDFLFPYLYFLVLLQWKHAIRTKIKIPSYQYHWFLCIKNLVQEVILDLMAEKNKPHKVK